MGLQLYIELVLVGATASACLPAGSIAGSSPLHTSTEGEAARALLIRGSSYRVRVGAAPTGLGLRKGAAPTGLGLRLGAVPTAQTSHQEERVRVSRASPRQLLYIATLCPGRVRAEPDGEMVS